MGARYIHDSPCFIHGRACNHTPEWEAALRAINDGVRGAKLTKHARPLALLLMARTISDTNWGYSTRYSIRELAEELGISKPKTRAALDEMVNAGLLKREELDADTGWVEWILDAERQGGE